MQRTSLDPNSRHPARPWLADGPLLAALLAGAAFSFYQVGSPLFACGRELAGSEVYYWLALAAAQGATFLLGAHSERADRIYRLLQYLTLPALFVVLAQLALAFPRPFVLVLLFGSAYWLAVSLPAIARGGRPRLPEGPAAFIAETTVFLLALLVVHTAIAFLFLHIPGARFDDFTFWCIAAGSAGACAWIVRREAPAGALSLGDVPPLALLVIVLLRAKFPDGTYDALLYKATTPIMIADWRTAFTGALDHTAVGTNFAEIAASQLRILDPAYPPAIASALAFLALWAIAPLAVRGAFREELGAGRELGCRAGALLMVSVTEALIAAGTSYHEPLMSLFMAAFLLPMSAAWLFLAAAIATKATVLLAVPVLLALRLLAGLPERPREMLGAMRARLARPVVLAACLAIAALVVGEQIHRNLAFTGRVLGVTNSYANLTDPRGEVLSDDARFSSPAPGRQAAPAPDPVFTLVHMLTLDRWLETSDVGFHALPSSRLVPIAFAFGLALVLVPGLRRPRRRLALFALWAFCAVEMLYQVQQGRYFAPLSFVAALLVAYAVAMALRDDPEPGRRGRWFAIALAIAAFGDQVAGTFINNGWECRRSLATPVVPGEAPDRPMTGLERRLAQLVAEYRAKAPPGGSPPTIACEPAIDQKHYVGAHYIYAEPSMRMTGAFLAADPARVALLPTSVLALCFKREEFVERMIPPAVRAQFVEVPGADGVRILVSQPLQAGALATSLQGSRSKEAFLRWDALRNDLMARWERGRLLEPSAADTPSGKGSFITQVDGERVAVLITGYRIVFDDVALHPGGALEIEVAMPSALSDGMALQVTFEDATGSAPARLVALLPPAATATRPAWETRRVPVPPGLAARGRVTLAGATPTGTTTADWAYLRRAEIMPR